MWAFSDEADELRQLAAASMHADAVVCLLGVRIPSVGLMKRRFGPIRVESDLAGGSSSYVSWLLNDENRTMC